MKKLLLLACLYSTCVSSLSAFDFSMENEEGVTIFYNKLSDSECQVTYQTSEFQSYAGVVNIPNKLVHDGMEMVVKSIGDNAFYDCFDLLSVSIPEGMTSIGKNVFINCYNLEDVKIAPENNSFAFFDGALYDKDVRTLLFCLSKKAGDFIIPSSVQSISEAAFSNCPLLNSVVIPEGVVSIPDHCFYGCSRLTEVQLPASLTSISDFSFYDCGSLTSVHIPATVKTIGDFAFKLCSQLESVSIPNNVTTIGSSAFSECSSLKSITVPDKVQSIQSKTFMNCVNLNEVNIGKSVKRISGEAFAKCTSLTSIQIPNSVTEIGENAFSDCFTLSIVTLGSGLKNIGDFAFYSCSSLKNVKIEAKIPPACVYFDGHYPFEYTNGKIEISLEVPYSSASAYQTAACWKDFYNMTLGVKEMAVSPLSIGSVAGKVVIRGIRDTESVEFFDPSGKYLGTISVTDGYVSFETTQKFVFAKIGKEMHKVVVY